MYSPQFGYSTPEYTKHANNNKTQKNFLKGIARL